MKDREYREGERPENLLRELGYETQDVDYPKVIKSGVVLYAFFIGATIIVWLMIWRGFFPTKLDGARSTPAAERQLPPAGTPLLQSNITTKTDIMDLRGQETKLLDKPAYDAKRKTYTIPIEKAMDIVAKRGAGG